MARIGKQIPHFENVDMSSVNAVFSTDRVHRYRLSISYNDTLLDSGRDKCMSIILKNPSAADESMADATIRKVETFIYHRFKQVREIHILNLFAFRSTEAIDLNTALRNIGPGAVIGPENDHVIEASVDMSDYLILAWGNNSGIDRFFYEDRIDQVKSLLSRMKKSHIFVVKGKKETKHPLHGLMWGYNFKIETAINYLGNL